MGELDLHGVSAVPVVGGRGITVFDGQVRVEIVIPPTGMFNYVTLVVSSPEAETINERFPFTQKLSKGLMEIAILATSRRPYPMI
jgi:hypothetical protein